MGSQPVKRSVRTPADTVPLTGELVSISMRISTKTDSLEIAVSGHPYVVRI